MLNVESQLVRDTQQIQTREVYHSDQKISERYSGHGGGNLIGLLGPCLLFPKLAISSPSSMYQWLC